MQPATHGWRKRARNWRRNKTKRRSRLVQAKPDVFKSIPASEYAQLEREESALDEKRGKQAKELAKCLDTVRLGPPWHPGRPLWGVGGRRTPPPVAGTNTRIP